MHTNVHVSEHKSKTIKLYILDCLRSSSNYHNTALTNGFFIILSLQKCSSSPAALSLNHLPLVWYSHKDSETCHTYIIVAIKNQTLNINL